MPERVKPLELVWDLDLVSGVEVAQDWGSGVSGFDHVKGCLSFGGPLEWMVLS